MAYFWESWWVTFSGWEPTIHAKKLLPIFKEIKKLWVHIALDTNASILTDEVKELLKYVDLVLPDLKHIDHEEHKKLTGKPNHPVMKFLHYLESIEKPFRVRHVLVPHITNKEQYLVKLWEFLNQFQMLQRLELLPYHELWKHKRTELWRQYPLEDLKQMTHKEAEKTQNLLQTYLNKVTIRW
jgi:pyruvate formate lyase activating enzyme